MQQLIIHDTALSLIDKANLKDFNREHKPVTVTVVDWKGNSQRFKLTEEEVNTYIIADVPNKYFITL